MLIAAHAAAAGLCLVLGLFQILRRTRGDTIHRLVGGTWVALMIFVAGGSFFFGGYHQSIAIFLRVLAVWTLLSVSVGVMMARRGNIRRHRGLMVGNYVGLVAAFVGVLAVHTRRVPSWFVAHPLMMSLIAVAVVAVAGFFLAAVVLRFRPEAPSARTTPASDPGSPRSTPSSAQPERAGSGERG